MKSESELCTVIKNSMVDGFKVPDPTGQFAATIKRAYDGIGLIEEEDGLHFVCWEAKFLKSMSAFSLKRVEPHQDYYLLHHGKAKEVRAYLILGIDVSRSDKRVYIFEYNDFMSKLYSKSFSFHKAELEKLPYNKIEKGTFKFENIITKQIILDNYPNDKIITEVNSDSSI